MQRKIGLLTFHRAENFGASLQLLSLYHHLVHSGFDVVVIDYRNTVIEAVYDYNYFCINIRSLRFLYRSIRDSLFLLLTRKKRKIRKQKYLRFLDENLKFTKPIYNEEQIPGDFDFYICGSDQIWNSVLLNKLDPVYFLYFKTKKSSKKISYAASSEIYSFVDYGKKHEILERYLGNIDAISVREKVLALELQKYSQKPIEVVLDPTFLHNKEFYQSLAIKPQVSKYVLVYHLRESLRGRKLAELLSQMYHLKIIEVHAGFIPFLSNDRHKQGLGPLELLGYINNAEYVVTTSFHGLALSIILEKEFYVIDEGGFLRLEDLLNTLKLTDRIVSHLDSFFLSPINYVKVKQELELLQYKSQEFLKENMK